MLSPKETTNGSLQRKLKQKLKSKKEKIRNAEEELEINARRTR